MPTIEELLHLQGAPAAWNEGNIKLIIAGVYVVLAAIIIGLISGLLLRRLHRTLVPPDQPKGWLKHDYDAERAQRQSLQQYAQANNIPDSTPMVNFSVATANFGGIFTEDVDPWAGTVSPEAARLQVDAGARAVVFDIWPDPADTTSPIVASMVDVTEWNSLRMWRDNGLGSGVGTYSNWQKLTRNSVPLGDVLTSAVTSAFSAPGGTQLSDPFFIILNLHGAMTLPYLSRLSMIVGNAVGAYSMGADWIRAKGQRGLCTEPYTTFLGKAFVIVCPDVQTGFNSLPNTNSWDDFVQQFLASDMGERTNAIELAPNTMRFRPTNIAPLGTVSQPNCIPGGAPLKPPVAGFCIIQPTIGGQNTTNTALYSSPSYTDCLATGAQFVAVNLFSTDTSDPALDAYFDPAQFGTYSFKKGT